MLVAIADADNAVMKVIELASSTTSRVTGRPRLPTTHPKRRYMMRPRIVSTLGVKTPSKVPNWRAGCCGDASVVMFLHIADGCAAVSQRYTSRHQLGKRLGTHLTTEPLTKTCFWPLLFPKHLRCENGSEGWPRPTLPAPKKSWVRRRVGLGPPSDSLPVDSG